MPGVCRLNDICTGHDCWPQRPNVQSSNDTFVNSRGVHRQSDLWAPHCCESCHTGNLLSGSPDTFVNGLQAGRCGDPIDCGSYVASCSNDVIIN